MQESIPQSLVDKTKALWLKKFNLPINDQEASEILRRLALFADSLLKLDAPIDKSQFPITSSISNTKSIGHIDSSEGEL